MVQYCFTSTETIRLVRREAQYDHLHFHTDPEPALTLVSVLNFCYIPAYTRGLTAGPNGLTCNCKGREDSATDNETTAGKSREQLQWWEEEEMKPALDNYLFHEAAAPLFFLRQWFLWKFLR